MYVYAPRNGTPATRIRAVPGAAPFAAYI